MPTVVTTVDISAPAEAVASVLLDAESAPVWTAGLQRLEVVKGTVGEPGSVGLAHYEEGNRSYVLEDRLLSATPNRSYVSEIAGGGLKARVETTLEEVGSETRMTVSWSGTGTNPITWAILPFLRSRIAEQSATDLAALRELVEARWQDPTHPPYITGIL